MQPWQTIDVCWLHVIWSRSLVYICILRAPCVLLNNVSQFELTKCPFELIWLWHVGPSNTHPICTDTNHAFTIYLLLNYQTSKFLLFGKQWCNLIAYRVLIWRFCLVESGINSSRIVWYRFHLNTTGCGKIASMPNAQATYHGLTINNTISRSNSTNGNQTKTKILLCCIGHRALFHVIPRECCFLWRNIQTIDIGWLSWSSWQPYIC